VGHDVVYWGDFNVGWFLCKSSDESRQAQAMVKFPRFIFGQGLVDSVGRGNFKWFNNRDVEAWSQIDRFLLSPKWEEYFSDISHRHLTRLLSDHFSLMLYCGVGSRGSNYLKFENMWMQSEGFVV
jgi:endonuclease/exonuclease/phosphatase family metal-dependent hydrolase